MYCNTAWHVHVESELRSLSYCKVSRVSTFRGSWGEKADKLFMVMGDSVPIQCRQLLLAWQDERLLFLHSWGQLGFDKMLLGYLLISSVWCNSRRFMDRHSIHICCRHSRNSSSSSSSNSELAVTSCFHSWWCAWSSPSAEGTNWQLPKSKTVIRLIMIKLLEVPPLQAAHCMITIWTTEVNCLLLLLLLHRLPTLFPVLGRGIWGYLCPLALRPPSMQESQKEVVTTPLYLSPSSYSGGSSLFKACNLVRGSS